MKEKNYLRKMMEQIAFQVAKRDVNRTCPCVTYQPKLPEAVKKLKR